MQSTARTLLITPVCRHVHPARKTTDGRQVLLLVGQSGLLRRKADSAEQGLVQSKHSRPSFFAQDHSHCVVCTLQARLLLKSCAAYKHTGLIMTKSLWDSHHAFCDCPSRYLQCLIRIMQFATHAILNATTSWLNG